MDDNQNERAWEVVEKYLHLRAGRHQIAAPYYTNHAGLMFSEMMREAGIPDELIHKVFKIFKDNRKPYGWFRGKGSPEQLEEAIKGIAGIEKVDIVNASDRGIVEFMKLYGIGVDCSGLVYNILAKVFDEGKLNECLVFDGDVQNVFRAGAKTFVGKSREIYPEDIKAGDVIFLRNPHDHIALILQKSGTLFTVQSTATAVDPGVRVDEIKLINNKPVFNFIPERGKRWEELWTSGELKFYRLCIFI